MRKGKKKLKKSKSDLPPVVKRKDPEFSLDFMESLWDYDIPGMKAPSNLDVVRNAKLLSVNLPKGSKHLKTKKKKKGKGKVKKEEVQRRKKFAPLSDRLPYLKEVFIGDKEPSSALLEESRKIYFQSQSKKKGKRSRSAPDDEVEIKKLKTGEDAVAFFSRAGKNTAVKFVYLNRLGAFKGETADDVKKREYRPYSLVVVDHEKVNPEYFTMSASGVVHIQPNQPTEYMSLSDWMKESTMFNVLRRIGFFKHYLAFKCFKLWHKNARFKKFCKNRGKLSKEFFLAKKSFSQPLLEMRKLTYKLRDISLMDFNTKMVKNGAFELEHFVDQQQKARVQASEKFSDVTIESKLQQLCKIVSARARLEGLSFPEAIRAYMSGKTIPKEESKSMSVKKSKSMFESRQEEEDRVKALAKAKKERGMLGHYIRLVDLMSVESLISLCKDTIMRMYKELEWDRKKGKFSKVHRIMFNVYIDFNDKGQLIYTPTRDQLFNLFDKKSQDLISVVSKIPRLLNLRGFKNFFLSSELGLVKWRIEEAIENDEVFQMYNEKIRKLLKESFERTVTFGRKFENLREQFRFVNDWNDDEYSKRQHNHESFSMELQKVDRWLKYLKWSMQTNTDCGFLRVNSKRLKKYLEPKMERILHIIKKTINYTSRRMCVGHIEDLKQKIQRLDVQPDNLHDFAMFVDTLNQVNQESDAMRRKDTEITKIFELAMSNRDKVKTEEIKMDDQFDGYEGLSLEVLMEDVQNSMLEFVNKKTSAEVFKNKNMTKNTQELDSKINNVEQRLMRILKELQGEQFTSSSSDSEEIAVELGKLGEEIKEIKGESEKYNEYKKLFRDHPLPWMSLKKVETLYELRKNIWETLFRFYEKSRGWMNCSIKNLNTQTINDYVQFTLDYIEGTIEKELAEKFGANYKDDVVEYLLTVVQHWKEKEAVLRDIGNKHLTEHHWKKIFQMIGTNFSVNSSYTLLQLETYGIFQQACKDIVREVSEQATGEAKLQETLGTIEAKWKATDFVVRQLREGEEMFVLGDVSPILEQVKEHQILLQGIQANEHIIGVKNDVDEWERKLGEVHLIVEEWLTVQRRWLHMEYFFKNEDMNKQLHEEASKFQAVSEMFNSFMKYTNQNKSVIAITDKKIREEKRINHLTSLQECNYILDEIQFNLEDFLKTKRDAFPRFYFLSDAELLDVLSKSNDVRATQSLLTKCFSAIRSFKFGDESSQEIVGFISKQGEYVKLRRPVPAVGNVEFWMQMIEKSILETLRSEMSNAFKSFKEMTKKEWVFEDIPAQCLLTVDRVVCTSRIEKCFEEIQSGDNIDALREYRDRYVNQIRELVEIVESGEMIDNQRRLIDSFLVLNFHYLNVIDHLLGSGITSENVYDWQNQTRCYWNDNSRDIVISNSTSKMNYGYEYVGNDRVLVVTPNNERCLQTFTNSLKHLKGGCVVGPPGVGKTSMVKELANLYGRQCFVFNCSDDLNVKMMKRLFCGLAQTGAWACFDEFDRLKVEVLSVVGHYMKIIENSLATKTKHFIFEDRDVSLNPNYAVFVTMNIGNNSVVELPENLRTLLRPCSIISPDTRVIAETLLGASGFKEFKRLGETITGLFKHFQENLLSEKYQYCFDLRTLKRTLVKAGEIKRVVKSSSEESILSRAVRAKIHPMLLKQDLTKFEEAIEKFFPNVLATQSDYEELKKVAEIEMAKKGLVVVDSFIEKIVELFEAVRSDSIVPERGVIIAGAAATGKSTLRSVLADTLTNLSKEHISNAAYRKIETNVIFPKSLELTQLFGNWKSSKMIWTDGLIGYAFRKINSEAGFNQTWVVFDGELDSDWVENMNTVLDDSKVLCLTNGERIAIGDHTRVIFEVEDLSNASPSTVSRCNVVIMEEHHLDGVWRVIMNAWIENNLSKYGETSIKVLKEYTAHLIGPTIAHLRNECEEFIPSTDCSVIKNFLSLLEAFLIPVKTLAALKDVEKVVSMIVVFCYIWGLGGNVKKKSRKKFDSFSKILVSEKLKVPEEGTMFDYYVDVKECKFKNWETIKPKFIYEPTELFCNIFVPTTKTVAAEFVVSKLVENGSNVFISGKSGVGKSFFVENYLKRTLGIENPESNNCGVMYTMSGKTTNGDIQVAIEEKLTGKNDNYIGHPTGKKAVVFVKDVHLGRVEEKSSSLELLRQFFDQGGVYHSTKFNFRSLSDTSFIVTSGKPKHKFSNRLMHHLRSFSLSIDENEMINVSQSLLEGFMFSFNPEVKDKCGKIVQTAVQLFKKLKKKFKKKKKHYVFNFRSLKKVFEGISCFKSEDIPKFEIFGKVFFHEVSRFLGDMLVKDKHKKYLHETCGDLMKANFKMEGLKDDTMMGLFLAKKGNTTFENVNLKKKVLVEEMNQLVEEYNFDTKKSEKIVFLKDTVRVFNSVCRVLSQPLGSAVLLGKEDSRKKTISRLTNFFCDNDVIEVNISSRRKVKSIKRRKFMEHIKKACLKCGLERKRLTFLVNDSVDETILKDIYVLFSTGYIPKMFSQEDIVMVIKEIGPELRKIRKSVTNESIMSYFLQQMRYHIHFIFSLSSEDEKKFKQRFENYPALFDNCVIVHFPKVDEDQLEELSLHYLSNVSLLKSDPNVDEKNLAKFITKIHKKTMDKGKKYSKKFQKRAKISSKSFVEMIDLFKKIVAKRKKTLSESLDRYYKGVTVLAKCKSDVNVMKDELEVKEVNLKKELAQVDHLSQELETKRDEFEKIKLVVSTEERDCKIALSKAVDLKKKCESELKEAMPSYNRACKAVKNIRREELSEIKSFTQPPDAVKLVVDALCVLFEKEPSFDSVGKKFIGEANFVSNLMNFDKEHVKPQTLERLKDYIENPDFDPETIEATNVASMYLAMWIIAIYNFANSHKKIMPIQKRYDKAQLEYDLAQENFEKKQEAMNEVESTILDLEVGHKEALATIESLKREIEISQNRLEMSGKLVSGLLDEGNRWSDEASRIKTDVNNVIGDTLLFCAGLVYFGPFDLIYRAKLLHKWKGYAKDYAVPVSANYQLNKSVSPNTIREWTSKGLSNDVFSIQNAVIINNHPKCPLIIDPQGQATRWIRNFHSNLQHGLRLLDYHDPQYAKKIEKSIRAGIPTLVENFSGELDAVTTNICEAQMKDGKRKVVIRQNEIDFNAKFKLFLTTKSSSVPFSTKVFEKTCVIDFSLTALGFQEQLMMEVVGYERPDLEQEKDTLLKNISDERIRLKLIEDRILENLSKKRDTELLDDSELIDNLNQSKLKYEEMKKNIDMSEETAKKINESREEYRDVVVRGSLIYFTISKISKLNPMYQYSSDFFKAVFNKCLEGSKRANTLAERVKNLEIHTTQVVYDTIAKGLSEEHRLSLAFSMCTAILKKEGIITGEEWDYFLGRKKIKKKESKYDYLDDEMYSELCALSKLDPFVGLEDSLKLSENWKEVLKTEKDIVFPEMLETNLSGWRKLMLKKILRPDRLIVEVKKFISMYLGPSFLKMEIPNLPQIFEETNYKTPVMFLLSSGVDPIVNFEKFVKEKQNVRNVIYVSLGEGQSEKAKNFVEQSQVVGDWVMLQNCHLSSSWLKDLERLYVNTMTEQVKVHPYFRLWMTSKPTNDFPLSVLQNSVKVSFRPPKGLRAKLMNLLISNNVDENYIGNSSKKTKFKQLLFGLFFLHCVLVERGRFGPEFGWKKTYFWNNSDIEIAINTIRENLEMNKSYSWENLKNLIKLQYSGAICDETDLRAFNSLFDRYFNDQLLENVKYEFSGDGVYRLPNMNTFSTVKSYVLGLPTEDDISLFHLSEGVEKTSDVAAGFVKNLNRLEISHQKKKKKEKEKKDK